MIFFKNSIILYTILSKAIWVMPVYNEDNKNKICLDTLKIPAEITFDYLYDNKYYKSNEFKEYVENEKPELCAKIKEQINELKEALKFSTIVSNFITANTYLVKEKNAFPMTVFQRLKNHISTLPTTIHRYNNSDVELFRKFIVNYMEFEANYTGDLIRKKESEAIKKKDMQNIEKESEGKELEGDDLERLQKIKKYLQENGVWEKRIKEIEEIKNNLQEETTEENGVWEKRIKEIEEIKNNLQAYYDAYYDEKYKLERDLISEYSKQQVEIEEMINEEGEKFMKVVHEEPLDETFKNLVEEKYKLELNEEGDIQNIRNQVEKILTIKGNYHDNQIKNMQNMKKEICEKFGLSQTQVEEIQKIITIVHRNKRDLENDIRVYYGVEQPEIIQERIKDVNVYRINMEKELCEKYKLEQNLVEDLEKKLTIVDRLQENIKGLQVKKEKKYYKEYNVETILMKKREIKKNITDTDVLQTKMEKEICDLQTKMDEKLREKYVLELKEENEIKEKINELIDLQTKMVKEENEYSADKVKEENEYSADKDMQKNMEIKEKINELIDMQKNMEYSADKDEKLRKIKEKINEVIDMQKNMEIKEKINEVIDMQKNMENELREKFGLSHNSLRDIQRNIKDVNAVLKKMDEKLHNIQINIKKLDEQQVEEIKEKINEVIENGLREMQNMKKKICEVPIIKKKLDELQKILNEINEKKKLRKNLTDENLTDDLNFIVKLLDKQFVNLSYEERMNIRNQVKEDGSYEKARTEYCQQLDPNKFVQFFLL